LAGDVPQRDNSKKPLRGVKGQSELPGGGVSTRPSRMARGGGSRPRLAGGAAASHRTVTAVSVIAMVKRVIPRMPRPSETDVAGTR
jgi:hypothetical protein